MFQNKKKISRKYKKLSSKRQKNRKNSCKRNRLSFPRVNSRFHFHGNFYTPLSTFISEQFAILHSVLKQGHISHAAWRTGKRERSLAKVFGTSFARHRGLPVEFYSPVDQLRRCSPFPPSPFLPFFFAIMLFHLT